MGLCKGRVTPAKVTQVENPSGFEARDGHKELDARFRSLLDDFGGGFYTLPFQFCHDSTLTLEEVNPLQLPAARDQCREPAQGQNPPFYMFEHSRVGAPQRVDGERLDATGPEVACRDIAIGRLDVHIRNVDGHRLSAAELGQTSIHYQGKTGPFGSRGAIEEYIGNNELAAEAVKRYAGAGIIKTVDECTPRHLDESARSGCPIALQLWEDTAEMLGCLIMNLMYTLVPDAFIIGGGVAKAGDLLMKPLLENLRKQLFPLLMEDLKILPARFGAEAGLLGAGAMAMDEFMGMGILERFKDQKSTQTFC